MVLTMIPLKVAPRTFTMLHSK